MSSYVRTSARVPLRCHVELVYHAGARIDARSIDISMGGIALQLSHDIAPGQICVMSIALPTGGRDRKIAAVAQAVYCRSDQPETMYRAGFRFLRLDSEGILYLAKYIDTAGT